MTEIDISFNDEVDFFSDTRKNWKTWIEELILSAKKNIKKTNRQEMSINFVDINKMHEINKNYRGKDRPTDVISFAIEDGIDN
ncbi:MAG: rRNA maturation RNase YbeY, partial [Lactobacillus iners]|nr:rRNA maturation RNase YbeY [Lactobacillus iners]MCT7683459.1 rRNA maturation RNase YbeY [Lactobacillus iners]